MKPGIKIPVIVGPTCSGKTSLSLLLAEKIQSAGGNAEIISADSRQLYKYLDIGTAKPSKEELEKVPHHFINMLEPDEDYNVSRFESDALMAIEQIISRGNIPIIAGGSGLYIKALIDGIFDSVDTDEEYRRELLRKMEEHGKEYLYNELIKVDPKSAQNMLPQNWKRVIRALEVYHITGKPIWEHHSEHKRETTYNFIQFGFEWDRRQLYENIEKRVDDMLRSGFVKEVETILEKGFDKSCNSLNTVGYKEVTSYLNEELTYEKAIELIKRNTRRYAKRQLTWFRADEHIKWFKVNSVEDFPLITESIISSI